MSAKQFGVLVLGLSAIIIPVILSRQPKPPTLAEQSADLVKLVEQLIDSDPSAIKISQGKAVIDPLAEAGEFGGLPCHPGRWRDPEAARTLRAPGWSWMLVVNVDAAGGALVDLVVFHNRQPGTDETEYFSKAFVSESAAGNIGPVDGEPLPVGVVTVAHLASKYAAAG